MNLNHLPSVNNKQVRVQHMHCNVLNDIIRTSEDKRETLQASLLTPIGPGHAHGTWYGVIVTSLFRKVSCARAHNNNMYTHKKPSVKVVTTNRAYHISQVAGS